MNLHNLLGNPPMADDCKCGKRHELPICKFIYRDGAINILPRFISGCGAASAASCRPQLMRLLTNGLLIEKYPGTQN
jgi:hypothetical protein